MAAEFTRVFRFLSGDLQGLPDRLARECGLNAATVAAIQRAVDSWQEQLARDLMRDGGFMERASAAWGASAGTRARPRSSALSCCRTRW